MKFEFKDGDIVTFNPYNHPITAKVVGTFTNDGDAFYILTGISQPLTSRCSGRSIMESEYFEEYDAKTFWACNPLKFSPEIC